MKIGMMSAWNSDSGVSVHAELIGKEWVKMGHQLSVFSFFPHDFHGTCLVREDEEYVVRCFTTSGNPNCYLDPRPILSADYEIFLVQDLGMLPKDGLGKIFHHIKRKALAITVIHDSKPSSDPSFYQFDWDGIVCFDSRYESFLKKYFPSEKIYTIPFPCHPLKKGEAHKARTKLCLPHDRKIVLIFGQRVKEHLHLLPAIRDVASEIPLILLVVSKIGIEDLREMNGLEMMVRRESPTIDMLYDYLHAADVLLLHRNHCDGAVVSSAAYQCLGSGCPILASRSPFFETLEGVVTTYSNIEEFRSMLRDILLKGERYRASQQLAEDFVRQNSSEVIARRYIDLFETLMEERRDSLRRLMNKLDEALRIQAREPRLRLAGNIVSSHLTNSDDKRVQPQ